MGAQSDEFKKYEEDLPVNIFKEYDEGKSYKESIGENGLYKQTKMNEEMLLGNQWKDEDVGGNPTPVTNVIKQGTNYEIANLVSNPLEFVFSFEGVPSYLDGKSEDEKLNFINQTMNPQGAPQEGAQTPTEDEELNAVAQALTAHSRAVWERAQMDKKHQTGARKAAISGSYVMYSPFDDEMKTGMYSTSDKDQAIKGGVAPEILDITNVYFGNPAETDVQKQPFIIVSQRKTIREINRMMAVNKSKDADKVSADSETNYEAGNIDEKTSEKDKKTTLLTKFWKEYKEGANDFSVWCVQACKEAVVKEKWDTELELYPIAIFQWEERDACIYGHAEITENIDNQKAINRMRSLEIIGTLLTSMPIMIVNRDVITDNISNDAGQIIDVRTNQDVHNSIGYLNPAQISPNWENLTNNLLKDTRQIMGANDAALGQMRPENTSAIIALTEAARLPLQPMLNRFYAFNEDIARIWGEMFLKKYGMRKLKIYSNGSTYYIPFDGDKYKELLLSVRVEVGLSSLYASSNIMATLTNLYTVSAGELDIIDILERVPDGYIPRRQELIDSIKKRKESAAQMAQEQAAMQAQTQMPQGEQAPPDITPYVQDMSIEELKQLEQNPEAIQQVLSGNAQ